MVNFLLVFSIALNILALLCIALLFIRQNRLAAFESRQEKALEEMEEIVSTFIAEIKEENELFLQRIHELDEQPKKAWKKLPKKKRTRMRSLLHLQCQRRILMQQQSNPIKLMTVT